VGLPFAGQMAVLFVRYHLIVFLLGEASIPLGNKGMPILITTQLMNPY
jgi:hypothetical protein